MIKFKKVAKKFGSVTALDGVDFTIDQGEFIFIIGPSGAGKTTLIRLILREYLPSDGTVLVLGQDTKEVTSKQMPEFRRNIGVVFQDLKILPDRTVEENVSLALKILGKTEEEIEKEIKKVLDLVGLKDRADFFPAQLSGGELQRVCIARAIVAKPQIVIADEPTGNLDIGTSRQIIELLKKINQMGKTVLMATHNFEIVNSLQERVMEMDQGKIVSDKKKGEYKVK